MKKALSLALAACLSLTIPVFGADAPHDVDVIALPATWETYGDRLLDDSGLTINGVIGQEAFQDTILFDVVAGGGFTLDMSFPEGRHRYYAAYVNSVLLNGEYVDDLDVYIPEESGGWFDAGHPQDRYVFTCTEKMISQPGAELAYQCWLDWDEGDLDAEHSTLDGNVTFWLRVHPAPAGPQAQPTNDSLTCNGTLQNPTVYKINDSNYFKIRDLAAILNETEKQFAVGYDSEKQSVTAATGQGYEMTGTELAGAPVGAETAEISNDAIYVNGERVEAEVYKIGGSNYFKLRDLGKALNFYVGWSQETGMFIETDKPYSE